MEDRHFFIVSPRDIVVGKPRDTDDRIDWLLQHDRFAEVHLLATPSLRVTSWINVRKVISANRS